MKIKSYVVTAKASPESLFASISKRIAEPLVLYVDRDEKSKLYFVAFHSRVNQSDALSEAVKNLRGKEKSKIIGIEGVQELIKLLCFSYEEFLRVP
ncbi:MAG: hypothetical protein QXR80_07620 [Desulfurococcaceae archaeon]